ncbi:MAG: 50S ribosomal protein L15e [Candidatus Diapherotrites archaeon]
MTFTKHVQQTIQREWKHDQSGETDYGLIYRSRMMEYRRALGAVVKVDKPFNITRARALGYKAIQGVTVARVRVRRGGGLFLRPRRARKPKRMGIASMTRKKSIQVMAEERAQTHYPNMEVLNSYKVGVDGRAHYFEVILVDPRNPRVMKDKDLNWIMEPQHGGRVFRGKTSAGQKNRGLGKPAGSRGTEKIRPSLRAHARQGK